jgi:hypothetical protein
MWGFKVSDHLCRIWQYGMDMWLAKAIFLGAVVFALVVFYPIGLNLLKNKMK